MSRYPGNRHSGVICVRCGNELASDDRCAHGWRHLRNQFSPPSCGKAAIPVDVEATRREAVILRVSDPDVFTNGKDHG